MDISRLCPTGSQRAMVALEAERELAEEAKERKLATLKQNQPKSAHATDVETFPHRTRDDPEPYRPTTHTARAGQTNKPKRTETDERASKSREQEAKLAGTNSSYVLKAKFVEAERPDLAEQVRLGTLSLEKAIKQIKAEQKAAARGGKVKCRLELESVGECNRAEAVSMDAYSIVVRSGSVNEGKVGVARVDLPERLNSLQLV